MSNGIKDMLATEQALREAMHLQALEANPLDAEQTAMLDQMLREGWSAEKCLAHLNERALTRAGISAAE